MARILIAAASFEGQTERIAHHIARRLEDRRHITRLVNLTKHEPEAGADDYDATLLASPVHRGQLAPEICGFFARHAVAIRAHASALVTVSLTAASHDADELTGLRELTERYLFEMGWHPDMIEHVAGAVHDQQLNVIERTVLHAIVRQHGEALEPSGHTEFTDWARLDRFIDRFASRVAAAATD